MRTISMLLMVTAAAVGLAWVIDRAQRGRAGSIRELPVPDPNLMVFEVEGQVHREAIADMGRKMLAAFDRFGTVNVVIHMPRFRGQDLSASFDPTALWAQIRSLGHIGRYAVVGPPDWAGAMIDTLDPIIPVEARTFPAGALDRAYDWARDGA